MPTRNVVLTEQQAKFVKQMVSSGRYQNASEVLREGIRLIQRQEQKYEAQLKGLREAAKIGIADIDSGCFQRGLYTQVTRNIRTVLYNVSCKRLI